MTEFEEPQPIGYRVHQSVGTVDEETRTMRCDVLLACECTGTILVPEDLHEKVGDEPCGKVQIRCMVHKAAIDVVSWTWRELDS